MKIKALQNQQRTIVPFNETVGKVKLVLIFPLNIPQTFFRHEYQNKYLVMVEEFLN